LGAAITGAGIGSAAALGITSEASLPKDKLSALGTLAGVLPDEKLAAEAAYKIPTKGQRIMAEALSTQGGAKPAHLAAVIANPDIMSDATPSTREVGKLYQDLFKKLGEKFDNSTYQEITGSRYKPSETQVARLQGIVADAMDKLDRGEEISAAEAFIARSAGKKALMNNAIADTPKLSADVAALDNYLADYKGIPELKQLGQQYFRASAKEALSDFIPRNKRGDPAVVRSLLMARYGSEALSALGEGEFKKAAVKGVSGAIMSPYVQGKVIPAITGTTSPVANSAAMIGVGQAPQSMAAIRALFNQRKKDTEYGQ